MRKLLAIIVVVMMSVSVPVALSSDDSEAADAGQALPSSYRMSDHWVMPSVKNQSPWEICYAFGTLGGVESTLLKEGVDVDLSELYLAASSYFDDERGSFQVGIKTEPYFDAGGQAYFCLQLLASGYGSALESDVPYSSCTKDYVLPQGVKSVVTVTGFSDYNIITQSDTVKSLVMDGYQPILFMAVDPVNPVSSVYDDGERSTPALTYYGTLNHFVTIAGWDDDVPASYFGIEDPTGEKKGAWLIKNSWGLGSVGEGYYYMSYYSGASSSVLVVDSCRLTGDGFNLYSYDDVMGMVEIDTNRSANMFTANGCESLDSVSFESQSENYDYRVEVYTGCSAGNPESGHLAATASGHVTSGDLVNVTLPKAVSLHPGEMFSVVVTSYASNPNIGVEDTAQMALFSAVARSEPGQSFVVEDGQWKDVSASGHTNCRIKAYTTDATFTEPMVSVVAVAVVAAALVCLIAVELYVTCRRDC